MKKCVIMCAPPGAGKSTYVKKNLSDFVYVNQDSQGPDHHYIFSTALINNKNVVVDRMNFNKEQRSRYIKLAKESGYETNIVVLYENFDTCMERCTKRKNHETIHNKETASKAINFFFSNYEQVLDEEADNIIRIWPEGKKHKAIICDLDGTLCNIDHRLHHIKDKKKNWMAFFNDLDKDIPNKWCADLLRLMSKDHVIVYCSGRPDSYRKITTKWLEKHKLNFNFNPIGILAFKPVYNIYLYMRNRRDYREDSIIKENLLDFEILTRFDPLFMVDDRASVTQMWRKRGYTCLQCAPGNF